MPGDLEPTVVRLDGQWDISIYPRLRDLLASAHGDNGPLLLDMSETSYVDTYSLSEIIRAMRRWDDLGRPSALLAGDSIYRTLVISGVIERLHAFRKLDEALAFLRSARVDVPKP